MLYKRLTETSINIDGKNIINIIVKYKIVIPIDYLYNERIPILGTLQF